MANTKSKAELSATEKSDAAAADRVNTATGETTADGTRVTQPGDEPGGIDMRIENPREPVPNTREGAEPVTPARGADPVGTPGTAEPGPGSDPVEAAKVKAEAESRIELRKVIIKRTYFPLSGAGALKAVDPDTVTPEDAVELPIEEARYLEESGVAQSADTYPFPKQK